MRSSLFTDEIAGAKACWASWKPLGRITGLTLPEVWGRGVRSRPPVTVLEEGFRPVMSEERHWSMVRGLREPGDLLARSDLCHLHDGRAEAESCAIDPKLQRQQRDVVLVARSGSSQHVWVVRRSLSETINGRLRRRSDTSSARPLTRATA